MGWRVCAHQEMEPPCWPVTVKLLMPSRLMAVTLFRASWFVLLCSRNRKVLTLLPTGRTRAPGWGQCAAVTIPGGRGWNAPVTWLPLSEVSSSM